MFAALAFLGLAQAKVEDNGCPGVSSAYDEHIGHAIHSMTLQHPSMFNPATPGNNGVPTVNMDLASPHKLLANAPSVELGNNFATPAFNRISWVLEHMDTGDDGLGPNWLPQERIVHAFHMQDLWERIRRVYINLKDIPDKTCQCLLRTGSNGIEERLEWIHDRYKVDTPISLHEWGTQIPKLTTSDSWKEWEKRFSYYYTSAGDEDAAIYLKCALAKFE